MSQPPAGTGRAGGIKQAANNMPRRFKVQGAEQKESERILRKILDWCAANGCRVTDPSHAETFLVLRVKDNPSGEQHGQPDGSPMTA